MATQEEKATLRKNLYAILAGVDFPNCEQTGMIAEGMLIFEKDIDQYVVVKVIMKGETFDADDALEEYADLVQKRAERERVKAEKAEKAKK